jgi:UDP-N-acetyl-D-mannosaminuronic acid transferase (WecB/TagA/CpsF family)
MEDNMKKFLLGLLMIVLCGYAFAAGPNVEESQFMQFSAADQETTTVFAISSLVWCGEETAAKDIAADDDLTLEDGAGVVILDLRADAANLCINIIFPTPIVASGLKAEDLDGGVLHVYGQRK